MAIRITKCEAPEVAIKRFDQYPFGLVYEISRVLFGRTSDMGEIKWDEVTDARFFSDTEELRYFIREGEPAAVLLSEDGDSEFFDEERTLAARFFKAGKSVTIRKYINYDEDGQAFVEASRLVSIKED